MKTKQLLTLFTITLFVFAISSCKKNNESDTEEIETTFELSSSQAVTDNLTQHAEVVMEQAAARNNLFGSTQSGTTTLTNNWLPPV